MNNKDVILVGIQKACDEYETLLEQATMLIKGKAHHIVKSPVSCAESDFGTWFYSDGQNLSPLSGFDDVESAHKEFHHTYECLYEGAREVSDAESLDMLNRHFSKLENQYALSIQNLEKMEQILLTEGDHFSDVVIMEEVVEEELEGDIETTSEPEEVAIVSSFVQSTTASADLRKQLIEQDLLQLQQEQELTELELKQLEERQRLTKQTTEQIEQYQALKEQEINQQLNEHALLEETNINDIYIGQQELSRIKEDILFKHDELEQLALVDQKLDERKAEEQEKERKILSDFESRQSLDKQDLIQLAQQRQTWESEAERLKQQLALIEQDLEALAVKESQKQELIDQSNSEKEAKLQELIQQSRLQDKLNGHKIRVKETKQEELNQLEEELILKKDRLKELEEESVSLESQKVNIDRQHQQELKELDERLKLKKTTIKSLEEDKARKEKELKDLVQQQSVNQQNLAQIDSQKVELEKELEEV